MGSNSKVSSSSSFSAEKFHLRWNDFESNVSGSFRELRRSPGDLSDVSLACLGDNNNRLTNRGGQGGHAAAASVVRAHRVVLSACSAFFREVFTGPNAAPNNSNLVVYLRGVKLADLEALMDFMYHGEVNVAQEDLTSFLAVAEDLQVKGLTHGTTTAPKAGGVQQSQQQRGTVRKSLSTPLSSSSSSAVKRPRKEQNEEEVKSKQVKDEEDNNEDKPEEEEEEDYELYGEENDDDGEGLGYDEDSFNGGAMDDDDDDDGSSSSQALDDEIERLVRRDGESGWACSVCGKTARVKRDVKRHVESKHVQTGGFLCDVCCVQSFKTRTTLARHKRKQHGMKGVATNAGAATAPTAHVAAAAAAAALI